MSSNVPAPQPNDLLRIRYVDEGDECALSGLYKRLDSCNGSPEKAKGIIDETRNTLNGAPFTSVTLLAERIDRESGKVIDTPGTGRLIRIDPVNGHKVHMYEDYKDGLVLEPRRESVVEFAGATVLPSHEGMGVGKALTTVRALVLRMYKDVVGVEQMIVEFLPHYDDEERKINAFWTELILPSLRRHKVLGKLKKDCSKILGRKIVTDEDLLIALVKDLESSQRDLLVSEYFPTLIDSKDISLNARRIMSDVGKDTIGAKRNLESVYAGTLRRSGSFPIDGGPNFSAPIEYGALGDATVPAVIVNRPANMDAVPSRAIISIPHSAKVKGMSEMVFARCSGVFTDDVAKITAPAARILGISSGDLITYRELSMSRSQYR